MAEVEFSDEVLEETPERTTSFLSGMGAVPDIRTLLFEKGGMADKDIEEGRALLLACIAAPTPPQIARDTEAARKQRAATAEADNMDEELFAITKAPLRHRYPSQNKYMFQDLSASQGPQAVHGLATYCARYRALYDGSDPNRKETRAQDKEAMELLAKRGITLEKIAYIEKLIQTALGPTPTLPEASLSVIDTAATRKEKLTNLKIWFDDWATTARTVIKKRSYLIRLGLAQRRSPKKEVL